MAHMNQSKKRIAVMFGGISPEHDVSIITGLQALSALDPTKYDAFPVYVDPKGAWRVGGVLRDRGSYMLSASTLSKTTRVILDGTSKCLKQANEPLIGKCKSWGFDAALLAFHGGAGEAGGITGTFDMLGIPYTGMSTLGCSSAMDKVALKTLAKGLGIPVLQDAVIPRPDDGGYQIDKAAITKIIKDIQFPMCVKPVHMGSSIGAAKVTNIEELQACLPAIFEYDTHAMVEPFIENLVEYNIAAASWGVSAIERPKTSQELLDFRTKYCSDDGQGKMGGAKMGGTKTSQPISQGMLAMTRDIAPDDLPKGAGANIQKWAAQVFKTLGNKGAPRMDFYGDAATGQIWLNEVNPYPGSLAYFLWEAAEKQILFTEFLDLLISQAFKYHDNAALAFDPVPVAARLLPRHGA